MSVIFSMSVSVDGYIAGRDGAIGWGAPDEELFRFHIQETQQLGVHLCGRKLYETMLPWETDPSMRERTGSEVRRRVVGHSEDRLQSHAHQR